MASSSASDGPVKLSNTQGLDPNKVRIVEARLNALYKEQKKKQDNSAINLGGMALLKDRKNPIVPLKDYPLILEPKVEVLIKLHQALAEDLQELVIAINPLGKELVFVQHANGSEINTKVFSIAL